MLVDCHAFGDTFSRIVLTKTIIIQYITAEINIINIGVNSNTDLTTDKILAIFAYSVAIEILS